MPPHAAQSTQSSRKQRRNFSPSAGLLACCVCCSAPEQMGSRRHAADDPTNARVRYEMNARSHGTSARRFRSLISNLNVTFFHVTLLENNLGGFKGFSSFFVCLFVFVSCCISSFGEPLPEALLHMPAWRRLLPYKFL